MARIAGSQVLRVLVTPQERDAFRVAADAEGKQVGQWLCEVGRSAARGILDGDREGRTRRNAMRRVDGRLAALICSADREQDLTISWVCEQLGITGHAAGLAVGRALRAFGWVVYRQARLTKDGRRKEAWRLPWTVKERILAEKRMDDWVAGKQQ